MQTINGRKTIPGLYFVVLICIFSAGCTIPHLGMHAGAGSVPASYGLNDGPLTVHFIDVDQGDSELLEFGNFTMLIDAGETDEGQVVVNYLKGQGIKEIDLLIATHPHSDHIGGMQAVLKNFKVKKVLDSGMPHTTVTYEKFLETIDRQKIPYSTAHPGDVLSPAPDLTITILNAPDGSTGQDLNDASIVTRVTYGRINILFEADADNAAEDRMLASGLPLQSQILKVAHHGSPYSSSSAFLEQVSPEVAIISVGAGNPYNDPSDKALGRLGSTGAVILRTDTDGSVIVRTDGMKFSIVTARGGAFPVPQGIQPMATS